MASEFILSSRASDNFEAKTLLLPAASVGNIGQLAVDLLVNTWKLPLLGHLLEPNLLPCFGSSAYDENGSPTTELQLFGEGDLVVLQQRSPTPLGREEAFAQSLTSWIQAAKFKQVLVLGSIDAELRRDAQLEGSQLRFLAQSPQLAAAFAKLGLEELEDQAGGRGEAWEGMLLPPWTVWRNLLQHKLVAALLVAYSSDGGGNTAEAAVLASAVQGLLESTVEPSSARRASEWKAPISWSSLFGTLHFDEIY